ncbi:hypothetical protein Rs2_02729 [Raphanus sativus]|nr:hypothetical protein Rs2_02729 [Raphanus sativus]
MTATWRFGDLPQHRASSARSIHSLVIDLGDQHHPYRLMTYLVFNKRSIIVGFFLLKKQKLSVTSTKNPSSSDGEFDLSKRNLHLIDTLFGARLPSHTRTVIVVWL